MRFELTSINLVGFRSSLELLRHTIILAQDKIMAQVKKKAKKKTTKKRSNKYQKKLSLYGIDEKEILKAMLNTPPISKEEEK